MEMTTMDAHMRICRSKKTGNYILLTYAPNAYGIPTVAGDFVHVEKSAMGENGLDTVLYHLRESAKLSTEVPSELESFDAAQARKFFASHPSLSVSLRDSNRLELSPLYKLRGRLYGTRKGENVELTLPTTNESFLKVMEKAYASMDQDE